MSQQSETETEALRDSEWLIPEAPFRRLGFTAEEIEALTRQGFVSQESRGAEATVFKLRFRVHGRQRVRFLGRDPAVAQRVGDELQKLQTARRMIDKLRAVNRAARELLRQSKQRLLPLVAQAGYQFHGRAIRRPHRAKIANLNEPLVPKPSQFGE